MPKAALLAGLTAASLLGACTSMEQVRNYINASRAQQAAAPTSEGAQ